MRFLLILSLLFSIFACSPKKPESEEDVIKGICESQLFGPCINGISDFTYPATQIVLSKNQATIYLVPTYNASAFMEFYTDPSLPSGLIINRDSGIIAGSPTVRQEERTYTIVARYKDESIRQQFIARGKSDYITTFDVKIRVLDIPPEGVTINRIETSINRRDNLDPIKVTAVTGGSATSYEVSPALPEGLFLNTTTGEISGNALVEQERTEYTLVARNEAGIASVKFYIEIKGVPPQDLRYLDQSSMYYAGENIPRNNNPIYSGDQAESFSISPSLPQGLVFDSITGVIAGNPRDVRPNTVYTVTATNKWGSSSTDISLSTLSNITSIATGFNHTCVVKNKTVRCSGRNEFSQLGRITNDSCIDGLNEYNCSRTFDYVKYQLTELEALSVTIARNTSCSLGVDKRVYCWGENNLGQLGAGVSSTQSVVPVVVKLDNGMDLTNVKKVEGGDSHFCAQNESGEMFCWGNNNLGQLGVSVILYSDKALRMTDSTGFVSGVTDFSVGLNNSCIVKDSKVKCVGNNNSYNIGDGSSANKSLFTETLANVDEVLTGVKNVFMGESFTVAIKQNNDIVSWGTNSYGQLATGDTVTYTMAVDSNVNGIPLNDVKISKGNDSFCYVKDGYGYCVGANYYNFGEPQVTSVNTSPKQIIEFVDEEEEAYPMFGITQISSGFSRHRCVAKRGDLFCFGNNPMGQIGDGSSSNQLLPKLISLPD